MPRFIDLTNKEFGRLTVIGQDGRSGKKCIMWSCRCVCGNISRVDGNNLRSGHTTSCGCYHLERLSSDRIIHGHCTRNKVLTSEYNIWVCMKGRCYNPNTKFYHRYGGRGISVCSRWKGKNGFTNFLKDMGARPTNKHSINRINNDGNYTPSNCEWATRAEQLRNFSKNVWLEYNGKRLIMADWARLLGVGNNIIHSHLKRKSLQQYINELGIKL